MNRERVTISRRKHASYGSSAWRVRAAATLAILANSARKPAETHTLTPSALSCSLSMRGAFVNLGTSNSIVESSSFMNFQGYMRVSLRYRAAGRSFHTHSNSSANRFGLIAAVWSCIAVLLALRAFATQHCAHVGRVKHR